VSSAVLRLLVFVCATVIVCAQVSPRCHGTVNQHAVVTTAPVLLKSVKNGQLLQVPINNGGVSPPLLVAHVYGSAFEMGEAAGSLLKAQLQDTIRGFFQFVVENIDEFVGHWPPVLQDLIDDLGVAGIDAALELTALATEPFTPAHFTQEMQGWARGAGISFDEFRRIQMFPELIKAACSMVGAWASASASGDLIQLRALDWTTSSPFQKHPLLMVYHPSANNSNDFAVLTWPGLMGGVGTTVNSASLATCEKVWLAYNGTSARFGEPWNFVLRDVAQFASTNAEAVNRIKNAHRTCSIFAGVGSKADGFDVIEYSYSPIVVWTNASQPNYTPGHPRIADIVYVDKHVQPSSDTCLPSLLETFHGKIDAEVMFRNITARFQTGDMHVMVVHHGSPLTVYISNAAPVVNGKSTPAYDLPFVRLNMDIEFARQLP
jgi:hypothetical protein